MRRQNRCSGARSYHAPAPSAASRSSSIIQPPDDRARAATASTPRPPPGCRCGRRGSRRPLAVPPPASRPIRSAGRGSSPAPWRRSASSSGGSDRLTADGAGAGACTICSASAVDVGAAERQPAGQHLEQHDAEREDVGAVIDPLAERLLRRQVGDGLRALRRRGRHHRRRPARAPRRRRSTSPGRSRESSRCPSA